jgi:hypothetical protein
MNITSSSGTLRTILILVHFYTNRPPRPFVDSRDNMKTADFTSIHRLIVASTNNTREGDLLQAAMQGAYHELQLLQKSLSNPLFSDIVAEWHKEKMAKTSTRAVL